MKPVRVIPVLLAVYIMGISASLWASDKDVSKPQGENVIDYSSKGYDNIRQPDLEFPDVESERIVPVDDRPIWALVHEGKREQARVLVDKYRRWYPEWEPPLDLLDSLREGGLGQPGLASDSRDWQAIIAYAQKNPEEFNCQSVYRLWQLADAYHATGRAEDVRKVYERILDDCSDIESRKVTLQRATGHLPFAVTEVLIERESKNLATGIPAEILEEIRYRFYVSWLARTSASKSSRIARTAAARLANPVIKRRDSKTARLIGWWEMDSGRPTDAADWFTRAMQWKPEREAAYGLALANLKANRGENAERVIREWYEREPRMQPLLSNIQQQRATEYFNDGDYASSYEVAVSALERLKPGDSPEVQSSFESIAGWSLYHSERYREAFDFFLSLYVNQPDKNNAEGMLLSGMQINAFDEILQVARNTQGPASDLLKPAISSSESADLVYNFYSRRMSYALTQDDYITAIDSENYIASQIMRKKDAGAASVLGWSYLKSGKNQTAILWFQRALNWQPSTEIAYGMILAKRELGDLSGAEFIAAQWAGQSDEIRRLHAELLLDKATLAYEAKDYANTRQLALKSQSISPTRRAKLLLAWTEYQTGNLAVSEQRFEQLYRERQDKESAEGLAFSALANNHEASLRRLIEQLGGPLRQAGADALAKRYHDRDQFILANETRASTLAELENIDKPSVSVQPYARHRDGTSGPGELDIYGAVLEGRYTRGLHRFSVELDIINLESGGLTSRTPTGTQTGVQIRSLNDSEYGLLEPHFSYQYESAYSPYFSIGATPIGGEIGALPVGNIGIEHRHQTGVWNVELFAESKQESILSISGLRDPFSGEEWGRVIDRGIRASLRNEIIKPWSVSLNGVFSELDGDKVRSNRHYGVGAGLSYDLRLKGFDYFAFGPRYQFSSYQRNLSFFTLGHGGYFSPEEFHQIGGALDFQTDEGRDFVVSSNLFLGYQDTTEEDTFTFPRTGAGSLLEGGDGSGFSFDGRAAAIYHLSARTQIGAFGSYTDSENFSDIGGGLLFRYLFAPRPAVFSSDLPTIPWNQ